MDLFVHSISAYQCISELACARSPRASRSSHDHSVVTSWSSNSESLSSTFGCTSHGIWRECLGKSSYDWMSVGRGQNDIKEYPAVRNHTKRMDQWKLHKSAWDKALHKIIFAFCKKRWYLSTPESPKYILPVAQSISVIPLSLYTPSSRSVLLQYPCIMVCPPLASPC